MTYIILAMCDTIEIYYLFNKMAYMRKYYKYY